jgi:hypothetical protein
VVDVKADEQVVIAGAACSTGKNALQPGMTTLRFKTKVSGELTIDVSPQSGKVNLCAVEAARIESRD